MTCALLGGQLLTGDAMFYEFAILIVILIIQLTAIVWQFLSTRDLERRIGEATRYNKSGLTSALDIRLGDLERKFPALQNHVRELRAHIDLQVAMLSESNSRHPSAQRAFVPGTPLRPITTSVPGLRSPTSSPPAGVSTAIASLTAAPAQTAPVVPPDGAAMEPDGTSSILSILSAWRTYFLSDGGRNKGDVQRLESLLRESLGPCFLKLGPHQEAQEVLVVYYRDRLGDWAYAVPKWHDFSPQLETFFDFEQGNRLTRIGDLVMPARVESSTGVLITRGKVTK
jgi:hypothetical protein